MPMKRKARLFGHAEEAFPLVDTHRLGGFAPLQVDLKPNPGNSTVIRVSGGRFQ